MSRAADSTFAFVEPRSFSQTEIADSRRGTGWQEIATAINTLYQQARPSLVNDYHPGGLLTSTTGDMVYRIKMPGSGASDGTLTVTVYVYVVSGVSGTATLRAASTNAGDTDTTAVGTSFAGWKTLTVDCDATNEYEELTIDMSAVANVVTVYGASVVPVRTTTTLADATDDFAYTSADGFVPMEITEYGGEQCLSATKARIAHENTRAIWETTHQAVATSYVDTPLASAIVYADVPMPRHVRDGQTATLRCFVNYTWTGSGVGVDFGTYSVAAQDSSQTALISSGGTPTWSAARDLTVSIPSDTSAIPETVRLVLSTSGDLEINQFSAYWRDLTYA